LANVSIYYVQYDSEENVEKLGAIRGTAPTTSVTMTGDRNSSSPKSEKKGVNESPSLSSDGFQFLRPH
jgi:hypothetical protein